MKYLIIICFLFIPLFSYSQSIISYHQSPNDGQIAYAYEFNERFRPEIRLFADTFIEDLYLKVMLNYDLIDKENFEFYSGITAFTAIAADMTIMVPLGLNVYPFENKKFGFMIEFSPSFPFGAPGAPYFAGSWGIRYKFNKKD